MQADLFLGIDLGTSGVRAVLIDANGAQIATAKATMADFGSDLRDPEVWWQATQTAVQAALQGIDARRIRALAVDGTSGTMLAVDVQGQPLGPALMYNDACTDAGLLAHIDTFAPASSAARGATSALARAIQLQSLNPACLLHQADWISWQFSGRMVSDGNNALKTGYDPVQGLWGEWIAETGLDIALLPEILEPGSFIGPITPAAAARFGLSEATQVVAGTTDGCASFLATGASQAGDAVSALGTTLTLKILSDRPIFAPEYGIYSHRLLGMWLAGGASNSGGAALLRHFSAQEIARLTPEMSPDLPTGLSYYPLPKDGERFPIVDPKMASRTEPRPASDAQFLQALFEGIAAVEALGFSRLAELGAPKLRRLCSVGGAAANPALTAIRTRVLEVAMEPPVSDEAAYGAALLARRGAR